MYIINPYRFGALPLLFDTFSNALFGYSMQKLKTGEVHAIRAERDSDNAQTDVELYDTGSIDLSSTVSVGGDFGTWAGSDTCVVVTWYDQSGNGNDITSASASTSPTIILGGVLKEIDGRSFADFDGANDKLTRSALTEMASGNDITSFGISQLNFSVIGTLWTTSTGNRLQFCHDRRSQKRGTFAIASTNAFANLDIQYSDGNVWQQTCIVDGTNTDLSHFKDGVSGGQNISWTGSYVNDTFSVGGGASGNNMNGGIWELIAFSDDKTSDRVAIEANQNTRYDL